MYKISLYRSRAYVKYVNYCNEVKECPTSIILPVQM